MSTRTLELPACTIDLDRCEVRGIGGIQLLTPQEASLLAYLAARGGLVVPVHELKIQVWGYAPSVDSAAVAVAVRRLRRKIERDPAAPESLKTVRGVGYLLEIDAVAPSGPEETWPPYVGHEATFEALRATDAAVVCLTGAPGIGKTRLAQRFVRSWRGPTMFASLRSCTQLDQVVTAVASALGLPPPATPDSVRWLGHVLRGRPRSLWVLDNAEVCIGEVERLIEGLRPALVDGRRLVVTSRVAPAGTAVVAVPPLEARPAVALFVAHGLRARPDLVFGDATRSAIEEICAHLDGLPLSIELAAARMSVLSLGQLRDRLSDRLRLLRTPAPGDPSHASLEAAIDVSWDLLSPMAQSVFAQCSVFQGGFTLDAAAAVLEMGDEPLLDVLHALRAASLIQAVGADASGVRFEALPSLAAYAEARLSDGPPDVRAALEARHGAWYARWAASVRARGRSGAPERVRTFRDELHNLEVACRRALNRNSPAIAESTVISAAEAHSIHGPFEAGLRLVEAVLAAGSDGGPSAALLASAARLCSASGRLEAAKRYAEESLVAARASADPTAERGALRQLAEQRYRRGDPIGAREQYEALRILCEAAGDRWDEAHALDMLAVAERQLGLNEAAHGHYLAALAASREVGHQWEECYILGNLGVLLRQRGDHHGARGRFEAAFVLSRELGIARSEAFALCNLGTLSILEHDVGGARQHLEAALDRYRQGGARHEEAQVKGYLAEIDRMEGAFDGALEHGSVALAILRELEDKRGEAIELGRLGRVHAGRGERTAARRAYDDALLMHRAAHNRQSEALTLAALGILDREEGRLDEARRLLSEARQIARDIEHRLGEGVCDAELGRVAFEEGRPSEARASLASAEALLRGFSESDRIDVLCSRAEVEERYGDLRDALAQVDEARRMAAEIGIPPQSELGRRTTEVGARIEGALRDIGPARARRT